MAVTGTIDISINMGTDVKTGRKTISGDNAIIAEVSLTSEQANKQVTLSFLQTDLTAGGLVFIAGGAQEVTVKTNSSSVPDDTFTVPASGFVEVQSLAADITALFVTNEDATATTLYIRGASDITP